MSRPFTPARVIRFLLLWFVALLVVWILFVLLTHARARNSITHRSLSTIRVAYTSGALPC